MGWGNVPHRMAAALACTLLTACCAPPAKPPAKLTDTWEELCAQKDCEHFPLGYRAEGVGNGYFYFPLSKDNSWFSDRSDLHVQLDEAGNVLRAATRGTTTSYRIARPCCRELVERFNLPPPRKAGFMWPSQFWYYPPNPPAESAGLEYKGGRPYLTALQPLYRLKELATFSSPEELSALDLPVFDSNFWLLKAGDTLSYSNPTYDRRRIVVISRRPVFFGRHVWMDCASSCQIATIVFPADRQAHLPNAIVGSLGEWRYPECLEYAVCDPSDSPYEVIPEALAWVESILIALQTRPKDAPPPAIAP